jgi:hypothetical protein
MSGSSLDPDTILDLTDSAWGPEADHCGHDNELSGSVIGGQVFGKMSKKDSAPWSWSVCLLTLS